MKPLLKAFDFLFLKKAGADPIFRGMYRRYLRFRSLLFSFSSFYLHLTRSVVHKFDFLLSIVTILCYPSDRLDDIGLIVSLVVSACIAVAHYVLGRFAVRSSRIAIIR